MPQVFQVLRCYKCMVFQVHQTKKSNKWECKLCGEKQSIKRHYGIGTAKDCRLHVQRLNGMRGEIDELNNKQDIDISDNNDDEKPTIIKAPPPIINSKWSNYTEAIEVIEENSNEIQLIGDTEVVLEIPKKRRKQFNSNFKRNPKIVKSFDQDENQEFCAKNNNSSLNVIPVENPIEVKPSFDFGSITVKEENSSKNNSKRNFIPPVLNKNSKWAQFTEGEENENIDLSPSPTVDSSQINFSFSLCDENSLDSVLNI